MPKDLGVSQLLQLYGGLLPEKQKLLCELYFDEDLSLAEISENEGITRQGVRDAIKRAEAQLKTFEQELGLIKKISALQSEASLVREGTAVDGLLNIIDNL